MAARGTRREHMVSLSVASAVYPYCGRWAVLHMTRVRKEKSEGEEEGFMRLVTAAT